MKKEPFILRHIFLVLAGISGILFGLSNVYKKDLGIIFFGFMSLMCLGLDLYFYMLSLNKRKTTKHQGYDKAHYHQARKQTFRVIKGGKK